MLTLLFKAKKDPNMIMLDTLHDVLSLIRHKTCPVVFTWATETSHENHMNNNRNRPLNASFSLLLRLIYHTNIELFL